MFGLAPFAGAPFSSVLQFAASVPVTGLVADTQLGTLSITPGINVTLTGQSATATLGVIGNPAKWSLVITVQ